MIEQPSTTEQKPLERKETDPWVEVAANFAEDEPAVLVDAAVRRVKERGSDPTFWQRAGAKVKRNALATGLAFMTVAGAEGMMPKSNQAGEIGRTAAEVGLIFAQEAERAFEEAYYRDIQNIQDMEGAWEGANANIENWFAEYEDRARGIAETTANISIHEKEGNTSDMREAMEYREMLRAQQERLRVRIQRAEDFQKALEERMGAKGKGLKKKRIGAGGARVLSRILERVLYR